MQHGCGAARSARDRRQLAVLLPCSASLAHLAHRLTLTYRQGLLVRKEFVHSNQAEMLLEERLLETVEDLYADILFDFR